MLTVELERSYLPHCVIGELHIPNQHSFYTIERPWRNNEPNVSCIPEGLYECRPFSGNRFKNVWQLMNVTNRTYILIHAGNWAKDVEGCIAVGMTLSSTDYMVLNSNDAIDELRDLLPDNFLIRITTKRLESY